MAHGAILLKRPGMATIATIASGQATARSVDEPLLPLSSSNGTSSSGNMTTTSPLSSETGLDSP